MVVMGTNNMFLSPGDGGEMDMQVLGCACFHACPCESQAAQVEDAVR